MADQSLPGPTVTLDYFLGALNTKLEALQQGNVNIIERLTAGDHRFELMDNRIQRIEHSLATLETDRQAAAQALERSATAAATFIFKNTDGNPQTMTNFSILAMGN